MSKPIVVNGLLCAVKKDPSEDIEVYWDRAWAFAHRISKCKNVDEHRVLAEMKEAAKESFEKRGVVFTDSG